MEILFWNLNISIYTPCLDDEECNKEGWSCFQYFCYPWSEKADAPSPKHFEPCRRSKDCPVGEKGEKGECYRHHSRRRVTSGICLDDVAECYSHDECGSRKCCNGNCCDGAYFEALKAFPCTTNDGCKDLLLGELCCVNIMGALAFETSTPNWNKVCCDNNLGSPIVQIPQDISDEDLQKIDHQISRMGVLKESICKGQEYDFMEMLPSCGNFTTTTTTTTTTPPTPKTTQPKVQQSQTQTSDASQLVSILSNLFALCSLGVLLA
ncbi:unnamed protein product [Lepeophtheirus salmonis]|uniref:(salmon louse) hypothetical protein n=1 Tax=Lepeophtheirus salmonis TaxID=72036 RepID=A0A7R8CZU8_LEPSM|nr:unnamed protein product [Lepeophtheirus salmonis]CAF2978231.1 unnamed protein product [Lepeophtheirus salmonis]